MFSFFLAIPSTDVLVVATGCMWGWGGVTAMTYFSSFPPLSPSFLSLSSLEGHYPLVKAAASPSEAILIWSCHLWLLPDTSTNPPRGLPRHRASAIKNPPANAGAAGGTGSFPGSGRSPGGGNGNPLQYSCLENPHGQRGLAGYVHRVAQSQTILSSWAQAHTTFQDLGCAQYPGISCLTFSFRAWFCLCFCLNYLLLFPRFQRGRLASSPLSIWSLAAVEKTCWSLLLSRLSVNLMFVVPSISKYC